ncbi:polyprenol phosphomannose-dependent alpha 1,6 mannosyltransferase MptB [Fulvivirga sp. 29W222]|uniref:Polyprenol phosphomannose-dependent alpha 1,6 mannosyltransferase MptB n=1 Tax=Fulvivirga marina TaxID=2494733 RepID=A0A937FY56_9BACT|nr:polyprenol phosphomannose-dependent alpha 1,6 mannosyltransferase MptB [Fulvivirga marina]MBL6446937.1 polyprenol phosphomannose-dependent alpha 1,6 mannosyltransferase MptB [Fulvivirga marina]
MVKGKSGPVLYLASVISLLVYVFIAYVIKRHESILLLGGYTLLFVAFLVMWHYAYSSKRVRWLVVLAIFLRLTILLAFPNLSDDIYRFVWDGRLINSGIHPFSHLPTHYMQPGSPDVPGITPSLFYQLNSPEYFTIYPPVAQFFFSVSSAIFPESVHGSAIVMRIFIVVAEVGSIWLITRILFHYKLPSKHVLLYALNPLIILELTGNLHFEAFMIFFLLVAVYFFLTGRYIISALALAFSIASKLLPLIFLPLLIRRIWGKQLLVYYVLTAIFTAILFLPLINQDLISGMSASLSLYFQRFEFNASIYYLLREGGFYLKGYNTIHILGKYLAASAFILITGYALIHNPKRVKLPEAMLWVIMIYCMLTTTLHPWYLSTVVLLSVFTPFRFPVLWSFLVFTTYVGYSELGFQENLILTTIEYVIVYVFMFYEIYINYIRSTHERAKLYE